MVSDNLNTASVYINNLLLSRGLLRNGSPIDFARPDLAEEGLESVMGRVMSLINDLILRRDRDATQRETLSESIRTLKVEAVQQTTTITRQNEKHSEALRKLGLHEGVERSLTVRLKTAEASMKAVKDEMARLRLLLDQTRTSCALEVRKREVTIKELKKRIDEGRRVRGAGKPAAEDLRTETNDFLTKMASGLREENEKLSALTKATFQSLQALSGYEGIKLRDLNVSLRNVEFDLMSNEMENVIEHLRKLLTNPSFVPIEEVEVREIEIRRLREGWERMEDRWKDAIIMMDGWKKRMEHGGRTVNIAELTQGLNLSPIKGDDHSDERQLPSARLMDRSLSTLEENSEFEEGDTQADIDAMDDSQVPITSEDVEQETEDEQRQLKFHEVENCDDLSQDREDYENEQFSSDDNDMFDSDTEENSGSLADNMQDCTEAHSGMQDPTAHLETQDITFTSLTSGGSPPQLSPLRSSNINTQENLNQRNHDAFTTIVEENTWDLAQLSNPPNTNDENRPPSRDIGNTPEFDLFKSPVKSLKSSTSSKKSTKSLQLSMSSRLPRINTSQTYQQSPITMSTIATKLAATEREADAARVRAKLRAAKLGSANAALKITPELELKPSPRRSPQRRKVLEETTSNDRVPDEGDEEIAIAARKRKGTKAHGGKSNRRRSTLSPWEMEALIKGDVQ